jgi:hypothetical protein
MSLDSRAAHARPLALLLRGGRSLMQIWRENRLSREADPAAYKLLVESLYSSPASLLPGGVIAALACLLCWRATGVTDLLALTVATGFIVLLRTATVVGYHRRDPAGETLAQTRRWEREFLLGATALSVCLGVNALLVLTVSDSAAAHLMAVTAVVAFSSGYAARNAGRPLFVTIQLVLFCAPMALGLILADDPYYEAIGWFCFMFVGSNIAMTLSVHRNLMALSAANGESKGLAAALSLRNATLDATLNNLNYGIASAALRPKIAPPARRWNGSRASWSRATCSPSGRRRNWLVFAPMCTRRAAALR